MVAALLAYELIRAAVGGTLAEGRRNAAAVLDLERAVGLDLERRVQRFFVGHDLGMPFWNGLYMLSQLIVLPATLVAAFLLARRSYPRLRTVVLLAWGGGLAWYALQPVAPPRLAATGVIDTVSAHTPVHLDSPLIEAFYNPVAAMPSLHVGLAPAVAWALWRMSRRRWIRAVAAAYPALVIVAVVVTGNHFVLDVLAGLALVSGAAVLARLVAGSGRTSRHAVPRAPSAGRGRAV
jgi:membrane-associated phospholipid phosphatase